MNKSTIVKRDSISEAVSFVKEYLDGQKIKEKEKARALLLTEEVAVGLLNHSTDDGSVKLTIRKEYGNIFIDLTAPGSNICSQCMTEYVTAGL